MSDTMTPRAARPMAQADVTAISMAADFAVEQKSALVPGDTQTLTRVGYLRRVPDHVVPILMAAWPHTRVKWTTALKATKRRYGGPPVVQTQRVINNEKVCFPLVYLEAFLSFLNPTGECHLAKIDMGLSLDPDAVIDLDAIPKTDPDF